MLLNLDYLIEDKVYKRKLALKQFNCAFDIEQFESKICRIAKWIRYRLVQDWHAKYSVGEKNAQIGNYCWDARPF